MPSKKQAQPQKAPRPVGLVFAEDENDARALMELTKALWADAPPMRHSRKPLVLMRDARKAEDRKKNADDMARVVNAFQVTNDVQLVIAHQDCDALEPAHESLTATIGGELGKIGLQNVVPVAPAWEIEAWWFLWPDAVAAVHGKWTRLKRKGNHGMIKNAKETLSSDLANNATRRFYHESDSIAIARNVRTSDLVEKRLGTSDSFNDFRHRVRVVAGLEEA